MCSIFNCANILNSNFTSIKICILLKPPLSQLKYNSVSLKCSYNSYCWILHHFQVPVVNLKSIRTFHFIELMNSLRIFLYLPSGIAFCLLVVINLHQFLISIHMQPAGCSTLIRNTTNMGKGKMTVGRQVWLHGMAREAAKLRSRDGNTSSLFSSELTLQCQPW